MWKPQEIIVHESVKDDPATLYFLNQCPDIPVYQVDKGDPKTIVSASKILSQTPNKMLDKIIAGKQVVYISPAGTAVDKFVMPDNRLLCPHFDRLKLASNGCFYQCDWCYLKLTYRANFPYITVKVQYDKIKKQLETWLKKSTLPVMFNSGELADSLSMEHLTGAGKEFIPWFGNTKNGYLFMLTKSDNVDGILNLAHNKHTVIAWSMNNDEVSRKYEIGAPSFERRLTAAEKVQKAGYPVRMRLDPIVPFNGWEKAYTKTIQQIFDKVDPERMTIGTLRFEKGFYDNRKHIFNTGPELPAILDKMEPMFEPKVFGENKKPKIGKYSFPDDQRVEIFRYVINEIRKYSDCKIALCKESAEVWEKTGLNASKCSCACQLDYADMLKPKEESKEGVPMTEKKPDIDPIPGHTNVLLIAPHGHDDDDKNTGKLVRLIAEQSGSYAIINEFYQKPDDPNNDETADKQGKRVNLNRKGQVEAHLKTEFLDPLIKYKNEIIERFGNVFLIWIHGADDNSVPKGIQVVVGYGQGETDKRHTADIDTIDAIIKGLNENNLTAIKAGITENRFCARDLNNMNQYFRIIEGKKFDTLQSFQLEFRMTGCRDTDESLKSTARNFINSISALVQSAEKNIAPAEKKEPPADQALVTEKITDPDEIKDAIDEGKSESIPSPEPNLPADANANVKANIESEPVEEIPAQETIPIEKMTDEDDREDAIEVGGSDPLVEIAYQKLSNIFSKNYEQALMEAGQYIVRTFYGGEEGIEDLDYDENLVLDPAVIKNARTNNSPRENTLNQLYEKMGQDKHPKTPSKAWIYNSVNLIVQWHDMKKLLGKDRFQTFRNLLLSQKLFLLSAEDDVKMKMIEVCHDIDKTLTVKEFKDLLDKLAPPSLEKPLSLQALLKSPEELMKKENAEKLSLAALKNSQARTLEKLKTITEVKHKNIETEIENLKQGLEIRRQFLEKYIKVKGNIEKAIQSKEKKPKKKKKVRSGITRNVRPQEI